MTESENTWICPKCGEEIGANVDMCPKCEQALCPECGAAVDDDDDVCPSCGTEFELLCPGM